MEIKTQKWVTIFEPNPQFDTLVSEYMNQQAPTNKLENNFSSYHSFKNISQLNLVTQDTKDNDFEDKSFHDFTKRLNPRNKSINFYLKSKKTKSFKEDDQEFFCGSPVDEGKNARVIKNEDEFKSIERPMTDHFEHINEISQSLKITDNPRSKSVSPFGTQKPYEVIGRLKKSSRTNFLKKEREESVIVQNKDEIVKENKLREWIRSLSRPANSISDSVNNDVQFDKIHINLCPRSSVSSERIRELSSNSDDQHALESNAKSVQHSKYNKAHSIFVKNNTQLSWISSKENEEDKNDNDVTLNGQSWSKVEISTKEVDISQSSISRIPEFDFEVNDSPTHESGVIETDFNAADYNTLLDKYLTKSSPLYKHLLSAHSSQFKSLCQLGKGKTSDFWFTY